MVKNVTLRIEFSLSPRGVEVVPRFSSHAEDMRNEHSGSSAPYLVLYRGTDYSTLWVNRSAVRHRLKIAAPIRPVLSVARTFLMLNAGYQASYQ